MSEDEKAADLRARKLIESGELKFDYIKSNLFRVIHVDGAWGSVTPHLTVQMAIFNERRAIPKQTVNVINPDGTIGDEIPEKRVERDAIVREVEADLVMDLQTAKHIIAWLQQRVTQIEKLVTEAQNKERETNA
jgi:hypothetical protein